jgi:aspartyl-tRNA(Asn)/glutamyl-tRNA(Gln) amidotransferase subunit C
MPERLSVETVRHVAGLARLDLTEEEIERSSEQLSAIAGHFADVEALDLADIPPTTHAVPVTNVLREDEVRPSLDRDAVLGQAPAAEDGRFRVPRILGEEP